MGCGDDVSDTLFDVDPWREATLADVKPGEWFSWPDRRAWKRMLSTRITERGNCIYDHTGAKTGANSTGGGAHRADLPVLIYRGLPPEQERAA